MAELAQALPTEEFKQFVTQTVGCVPCVLEKHATQHVPTPLQIGVEFPKLIDTLSGIPNVGNLRVEAFAL